MDANIVEEEWMCAQIAGGKKNKKKKKDKSKSNDNNNNNKKSGVSVKIVSG